MSYIILFKRQPIPRRQVHMSRWLSNTNKSDNKATKSYSLTIHTHTQTPNLPIVSECAIGRNSFSIMKPFHIVDDRSGDRTIENCRAAWVYYLNLRMNMYRCIWIHIQTNFHAQVTELIWSFTYLQWWHT